jgi:hypothetical protein
MILSSYFEHRRAGHSGKPAILAQITSPSYGNSERNAVSIQFVATYSGEWASLPRQLPSFPQQLHH